MPLITLITDFGIKDFFVGSLKGNIYSACRDALLVDITHEIQRHGLVQAAYVLKSTFHEFPKGSIHLTLIDTSKGNATPVLFQYKSHYFLGMDNGIFTIATDENQPDWIIELIPENLGFNQHPNLNNYFSAVIGALVDGKKPEELGKKSSKLKPAHAARPTCGEWGIRGEVIYIDSYENVVLNIDRTLFEQYCNSRSYYLEFKHLERIEQFKNGYGDVQPGQLLAFFNSSNHLEIAVNHGKAASLMGINMADQIQIYFR